MTEAWLQREFINECHRRGWRAYPIALRNRRGWPDVTVYTGGYHCLVELKTEQGKTSKLQQIIHRDLLGFVHIIVAYGFNEACDALDWIAEQQEFMG